MRLSLAALAVAVALLAALHGWLRLPDREPARVRTVELAPTPVEGPAEGREPEPTTGRAAPTDAPASPPSDAEEEEVVAPAAPFVEAPLAADDPAEARSESEPTAPDQAAWAARIRRMLAVYAKVGAQP